MLRCDPSCWELIVEGSLLQGSMNMAVDEYLFRSLEDEPHTYLRFYRWERPTVSLGYSQKILKVADVDYCRKKGIDIVRRMTGGKLVLHHKEVTYSLCSSDSRTFSSTLSESYRLISEGLMRGLEKMGLKPYLADAAPKFYSRGNLPCFSYPARNEIEVEGRKIVGSAQKRVGNKFLQHGSIPLEEDQGMLKTISSQGSTENSIRMVSLSRALGQKVSFDWAVEHLAEGFSEYFGITLKPKTWNDKDRKTILRIQEQRYKNQAWTFLR